MKRNCKLRGYVALADAFRSGRTTPRAYLDETPSFIDRHDSRIKAFVATNREGAIDAANASTARWRNDAPLERPPGGSSSGSAAAVGVGMVPVACARYLTGKI
jgi:Asp-tRNA(Asn)/Glu-tRNA(Gln) amidotransferase A subunit family amidase